MVIKNSKKGMEGSLGDRRHVRMSITCSGRERRHYFNNGGSMHGRLSPAETLRRGTIIERINDGQTLPESPRGGH